MVMTLELFLAALRHSMTALGVYAVAGGWTDTPGWETFTAEFVGVVGFGWSAWRKFARQQRTGSPL